MPLRLSARVAGCVTLLVVAGHGCAADGASSSESSSAPANTIDEVAIWSLEPSADLHSDSRSFTALVMRLGCNGARSAPVNGPAVETGSAAVVVTFSVDAPLGDQTCPGNDLVPVRVDLGEPLGDRQLLDGACRPGSPALATAYCPAGGDRASAAAPPEMSPDPAFPAPPVPDLLGAYCERAAALDGERPESYVGSQQHRADVYALTRLAPPDVRPALTTFGDFLLSGVVDPAKPGSNVTANWPAEVQAAVESITDFNAANC